MTSLTSYF